MIRTSPWPAGTPSWVDLSVPDLDAAKAFYGPVLGWDFAQGNDEFGGYTNALMGGRPVAGLGPQRQPEPVAWSLYIAVDDADGYAAAVTSAGGSVLAGPMDVGALGRLVLAADPTGAGFGLWQAGSHIGATVVNEPGGLTWEDLRSSDPAAAQAFYTTVFGYETHPVDMAGEEYRTFHHPGDPAPLGGIGGLMGSDQSSWIVYFAVSSVDEALAAVDGAGGRVVQPAMDTPYGRMAAVVDPFGAPSMIMQNTGQPQPDRGA